MTLPLVGTLALTFVMTLEATTHAHAAPPRAPRLSLRARDLAPPVTPSDLGASDDVDVDVEAERLFSEGEAAYERGDFGAAADSFAQAQALAPHPATLYNLGMAQHRAGDRLQAYATFERLRAVVNTPDERAEAIAAQQRVRRELSAVVVVVSPTVAVCLDDRVLPPAGADRRQRLTLPGVHRLQAYGQVTDVELHPGETQMLWLDGWADATKPRPPKRRKRLMALLGLAAGGGAIALGTGVGAAVVDDRATARGLGIGAAVAGALALSSALSAVLVARKEARPARPSPPATTRCDEPSPDVAQNVQDNAASGEAR